MLLQPCETCRTLCYDQRRIRWLCRHPRFNSSLYCTVEDLLGSVFLILSLAVCSSSGFSAFCRAAKFDRLGCLRASGYTRALPTAQAAEELKLSGKKRKADGVPNEPRQPKAAARAPSQTPKAKAKCKATAKAAKAKAKSKK